MVDFRIRAKNFFLTYPQCDGLCRDELWRHLALLGACSAIVSTELHQDGNQHVHALVQFTMKQTIVSHIHFDFHEWHPNVQAAKNMAAVKNYVMKDGNYDEYGRKFEETLFDKARRMTLEEYFTECLEAKIQYQYAAQAWKHASSITNELNSNAVQGELQDVKLLIAYVPTDLVSLVLIGRPGCGKTTRAIQIAPMPALFVTHMDDLKNLTSRHRSIIFDDMSFRHMPREAQIAITDREQTRSIHVRYGTVTIPKGIVKIFTANALPFDEDPAIGRRIKLFQVYCVVFTIPCVG